MKKFTLMLLVALLSVTTFAQKPSASVFAQKLINEPLSKELSRFSKDLQTNQKVASSNRRAAELVTPPAGEAIDYILLGSNSKSSSTTKRRVNVIFDGNDVYVTGLSWYMPDSWVKGVIEGNNVTFAKGQYFGNPGADLYLAGSDGQSLTDVLATYDANTGTFSFTTYILDNQDISLGLGMYSYWIPGLTLSPATNEPKPIAAPDGLVAEEYALTARNYNNNGDVNGSVYIGFADNDVYAKGFSTLLPEAWVKGTLDGTTIKFAAGQFLGTTGGTDLFFNKILGQDVIFTYDENTGTLTAPNTVFLVDNGATSYYNSYRNAVLKKVVEKAAMPANPSISEIKVTQYGDLVNFIVPTVDVDGEGLVTAKLSFQFFYDVNGEVNPIVFKAGKEYTKIAEDISVIPYGFTDNYDFYDGTIYLNMDHSSWNKIGIKSIYTGGGSTNETDIQWFTIENDEPELVVVPNNAEIQKWTLEGTYNTQNSTENVVNSVGVAISGSDIYVQGLAYYFKQAWIKGTINNGVATFPKWQFVGADNYGEEYLAGISTDGQTVIDIKFAYNSEKQTLTQVTPFIIENDGKDDLYYYGYWTNVVFYEGDPVVLEPVAAPNDLKTETYNFKGLAHIYNYDENDLEYNDYNSQVEVGFDGDDVYIQGLSTDAPELWVKGTKNADGKYVIPSNQYMGVIQFSNYSFPYFWTAIDNEDNLVDAVLTFDAETSSFSTNQTFALNGSQTSLEYYILFKDVTITKFVEVSATPAAPALENFILSDIVGYSKISANVPTTGTNNEELLTSKLFYTIWTEKNGEQKPYVFTANLYYKDFDEDVTEVPYAHDGYDIYKGGQIIYLEDDVEELQEWTKVGIQSIYYGLGERKTSSIVWNDGTVTGVNNMKTTNKNTLYFNLQGRTVKNAQKGLFIIKNESGKTIKVVR